MAIDWIKMRVDLQTHPKIVRILSAIGADKFRVIGGLHAVWSVFDAHSEDGVLQGYTPAALDHVIGWEGFSSAMIAVGWLVNDDGQSLILPEFGEHNGQSAKRRAEDQKRKKMSRNSPQAVTDDCGQNADKMRTRKEKKRKDISTDSVDVASAKFEQFWEAYPMKKGRADAAKAWARRGLDAIADRIIADVVKRKASDRQWLSGYIPHGSTYVNGSGWEDSIESGRQASAPEPGSAEYYLARAL